MLYYSVAHYYDKYGFCKYNNIKCHIKAFLDIKNEQKEFILISFIDTPRGDKRYEEIKRHLEDIYKKWLGDNKFVVFVKYNWGGTIAALWYTYLYLKSINENNDVCIAHFEEDFHPTNNEWFIHSKDLLNSTNYIYIGEHIPSSDPTQNQKNTKVVKNDTRCQNGYMFKDVYAKYNCNIIDSKYTDGGYYFSTLKNLKLIEEKIGIFHKGDQNTKWDHKIDGIVLGEVGFPSQVAQYYDFIGLDRIKYFSHEH